MGLLGSSNGDDEHMEGSTSRISIPWIIRPQISFKLKSLNCLIVGIASFSTLRSKLRFLVPCLGDLRFVLFMSAGCL